MRRAVEVVVDENAVEIVGAVNRRAAARLGEDNRRSLGARRRRQNGMRGGRVATVRGAQHAQHRLANDARGRRGFVFAAAGGFSVGDFDFGVAEEREVVVFQPAQQLAVLGERRPLFAAFDFFRQRQRAPAHLRPVAHHDFDVGHDIAQRAPQAAVLRGRREVDDELNIRFQLSAARFRGRAGPRALVTRQFDDAVVGVAPHFKGRMHGAVQSFAQRVEFDGQRIDDERFVVGDDADDRGAAVVERRRVAGVGGGFFAGDFCAGGRGLFAGGVCAGGDGFCRADRRTVEVVNLNQRLARRARLRQLPLAQRRIMELRGLAHGEVLARQPVVEIAQKGDFIGPRRAALLHRGNQFFGNGIFHRATPAAQAMAWRRARPRAEPPATAPV